MSRHAKFLRSDAKRWSKSLNDLSSKNTNLWQHHQAGDNFVWETHKVSLTRVPRFGFGIAVSGGKDNPHFANGDPSIAISDVLKAGPAEGKLLINDRVISVNGILLDNVEHSQAITVLKESGNTVHLEIKRRVVLPTANDMENTPLKLTLMKRNRKDDFGVVLGVQFYIKEIIGNSLASQDGSMKEGDYVLKINNTAVENLSLAEARKLIEKSKDKLQLCISKKRQDELRNLVNKAQDDEYSLGYGTLQGTLQSKTGTINDVNVYRSPSQNDDDVYKGYSQQNIPKGAYPRSPEHSRYDGRYVYDHEAPPRPPLPTEADAPPRPPSPGKDLLRPDDFYNSSAPRSPSAVQDGYLSDGGRYYPSQVDGGMRRRHDERYVGKRKDITLEPRYVYFEKEPEMGLGLRLAGGNSTGIFIASVQPGSGADLVGLTEGDKILKANDRDIPGMTREEAVGYLTSLQGRVSMAVQYMKEEYDRIMSSHEAGDSFYIRTHFAYEQKEAGELSFTTGDLFHVKDTLYRGVVGSWLVLRLGRNNQETQKGIIPNMNRAEQLAQAKNQDSEEKENSPSKRSILFRKNKAARRSKSLGKDHWEDVIFSDSGASVSTKFPAYERVVLKDLSFHRPVVIFGALADIAREKLLKEYPDLFESPQSDGSNTEDNKNKTGIIRLGAIKDIIAKRKHCLLDVTPYNVDKLNFAQYYPVVIFLRAENKAVVKDIRARLAKGSSKNPKKLFEQSQKLEKMYMHLMTSTISHNATDIWYHRLLEVVNTQQKQPVWVSEKKPEEDISDDYLFPMSNRLSFSPSRESEIDLSRPADDMVDTSTMQRRPLVRSSSDPSINTADRVPGIPPYPAPPSYHKAPLSARSPGMQDDRRYLDLDPPSEDRYYPSYYAADHQPTPRAGIDPYATLTPHERLAYARQQQQDERWYNPAYDGQAPQGNVYGRDHRRSESDLGYGQQRPSQSSYNDPPPPQPHHPHENRMYNDNSSYSGDSYSKYASNPANRHDDSKLRDKLKHDPYRFTRSTNNPVNTSHVDRSKLSELSAKYRKEEPSRSLSVPSLRPASSPPDSSVPFRDANGKKVPPPVPVKTYKDRGIEPDEMKIRNYEQTRSPYSDANSTYAVVNKIKTSSHHTNLYGDENPYDYVAPRNAYQRGTPNSQGHYSRPSQDHSIPENSSYERSRGPGNARSFVNQIYMDHQELQKLKAERDQQRAVMSPHGNQEGYTRDSGFTSPADRPRTDDELAAFKHTSDIDEHAEVLSPKTPPFNSFSAYKRLITPGFYTSPSHLNKQRERERERLGNPSDSDMDERGSAFEAYRKPTSLSTFGKSPEQPNGPLSPKSMQPNRHYSQPLSEQSESEAKSEKSGDGSIEVSDKSHDISQDASVGSGAISDQLSTSEILITSNGVDSSKDVGESHTVVATARGIFDHKGGVLESKETGVSIVIPEGAIPEGVQQEIYFKVCKDNNILPPLDRDKGETLLSPLVMCGPHGLKFLHPVELRLPHCASVNPDSWSFALKSSDSPSGLPTQWQNMNLAGGDGLTQGHVGKNSVSVLVDHF